MQLKLIPNDVCPDCGARTVCEGCEDFHVNGQGFEYRRFACGCELKWSPNFDRLLTSARCPHNPEETRKRQKRAAAECTLLDLLRTLDVDEAWKTRIRDAI